jgi:4-hydroxy-2-oxoheptanedioate aldolase
MRANAVKRALLAGRPQVGTMISTNDPMIAQIMANGGFDWVLFDMEHGPVTLGALQTGVGVVRGTATEPFARVAWNSSAAIQTALDCGVSGIMIPMIGTRADAEAAVRDARYSPLGERSRGGMLAALSFGTDGGTYRAAANDEVLVLAQIETREAIDNLDEIAGVAGIDCLYVGPSDLGSTYGVDPIRAWDDKSTDFARAILTVPAIARKHGKIPGIQVAHPAMAKECIALGFTLIGMGGDANFLLAATRKARADIG